MLGNPLNMGKRHPLNIGKKVKNHLSKIKIFFLQKAFQGLK